MSAPEPAIMADVVAQIAMIEQYVADTGNLTGELISSINDFFRYYDVHQTAQSKLNQAYSALEKTAQELRTQEAALRAQNTELSGQLDTEKANLGARQAEIDQLTQRMTVLTAEKNKCEATLEKTKADAASAADRLKVTTSAAANSKVQIESLRDGVNARKRTFEEMMQRTGQNAAFPPGVPQPTAASTANVQGAMDVDNLKPPDNTSMEISGPGDTVKNAATKRPRNDNITGGGARRRRRTSRRRATRRRAPHRLCRSHRCSSRNSRSR